MAARMEAIGACAFGMQQPKNKIQNIKRQMVTVCVSEIVTANGIEGGREFAAKAFSLNDIVISVGGRRWGSIGCVVGSIEQQTFCGQFDGAQLNGNCWSSGTSEQD